MNKSLWFGGVLLGIYVVVISWIPMRLLTGDKVAITLCGLYVALDQLIEALEKISKSK